MIVLERVQYVWDKRPRIAASTLPQQEQVSQRNFRVNCSRAAQCTAEVAAVNVEEQVREAGGWNERGMGQVCTGA